MNTPTDRIITAAERRRMVPYSDMHIWRLEKAGQFPKRLKLGPNRVGWLLSEVEGWIRTRAEARTIEPEVGV
jgi:prophage regulatory protein